MNTNKYILSIAGFDPSNGAGLTADLKTFEAFGLYGVSVCTSITIQNDIKLTASHWVKQDVIIAQMRALFERFEINTVKIGIVETWETLLHIIDSIHSINPEIKIILDPVLKSTSGYTFHSTSNLLTFDNILEKVFIITPNYEEIQYLYPEKNIVDTITHIRTKTNMYLKGGHRIDKKGWDELYYDTTEHYNLPPISTTVFEKHGSGCVLSSVLACYIDNELSLKDAALNTKKYIECFMNSNDTLLGVHGSSLRSKLNASNTSIE